MSQHDRSSSFMSLDCALHHVKDITVSQVVLFVSMLGTEVCALPEFVFSDDYNGRFINVTSPCTEKDHDCIE